MSPETPEAGESSQQNNTDHEIVAFFANAPSGKSEFNPFASNFIDEELVRLPTGSTIPDPNSVIGESGRFYHGYKQGESGYMLPNDSAEQDRLDLQHTLWQVLLDGKLAVAPLTEVPRLVLDVATGTGIWALEFARSNPLSFVIGTDLSKIQPNPNVSNCIFERVDAEEEWLWTHKFDYIHFRCMSGAFKNPRRVFEQAYASLKPGGWLEIQDFGGILGEEGDDRFNTSSVHRLISTAVAGMATHGVDPYKGKYYEDWLTHIGFSGVQRVDPRRVPLGPWPNDPKGKRIGRYFQADLLAGLRGISFNMLRNAGIEPNEIESRIENAKSEIKRGDIRMYSPCWVVYGQKPFPLQNTLPHEAVSYEIEPEDAFPEQVDIDVEIDKFFPNSATGPPDFNAFIDNYVDEENIGFPTSSAVIDPISAPGVEGRLYHGYKQGESGYILPHDVEEQRRQDLQHSMYNVLLDRKLAHAPLQEAPRLVLDVGTGTGLWALDFARSNPASFVVGVDLSRIQPVPDVPNCRFERFDCEEEWLWTHKFDYIHIRSFSTAFKNPKRLLEQAYASLNPGGWLEIQDLGFEILGDAASTSYLSKWAKVALAGMAAHGVDGLKAYYYQDWLTQIGFSNVLQEPVIRVPVGPWSKDPKERKVGKYWQVNLLNAMRGGTFNMFQSADMPREENNELLLKAQDEIQRGNARVYTPCWVVYGQKPTVGQEKTIDESGNAIDKFFANAPSGKPFNPFASHFMDEELVRLPTGSTVPDPNSVVGESGRLYHGYKEGLYLLPNDAIEQDRLDLQHSMWKLRLDGKLALAPMPVAPRLVLDVATGTGIWALEFARSNPSSYVIGTDLSKIQPNPDVTNCIFERDDCEEDWLFSHKFDYIHIRSILSGVRDPQRLIRQAFDSLNPGGWIEFQDADMCCVGDDDERVATSGYATCCNLGAAGLATRGIDGHKALFFKEWLVQTGFSEVREEKMKMPIGPWSQNKRERRIGQIFQMNLLLGLRGMVYEPIRSLGMPADEIEELIATTKHQIEHELIRGYMPIYVVYGQKPFVTEQSSAKETWQPQTGPALEVDEAYLDGNYEIDTMGI